MPTKQELWEEIIREKGFDLNRDFNFITANEIKTITGAEPRILAKFDNSDELPSSFKNHGVFILPIKNKEYVLIRGKGYHELEKIDSKPEVFKSRLLFELVGSKTGASEMQYIDHAYNSGLIEHFTGCEDLYLSIRGRKFSSRFEFRVDGLSPLEAKSVQIEVDAGYEGRNHVVMLEGKISTPKDFIIRQLYYPFRSWQSVIPEKQVLSVFFSFDRYRELYNLWLYRFKDINDYESIELVRNGSFKIERSAEPSLGAADFAELRKAKRKKVVIPQADDLAKILAFPFRVSEGKNNAAEIAKYFKFATRQSSYYREAAEALGLVELKGSKYHLTDVGKVFIALPVQKRNEFLARLIFELPVTHEILMELLIKPSKQVSKEEIIRIIQGNSNLTGSTLRRRAQTILAWFRWIQNSVGILQVEPGGIKL